MQLIKNVFLTREKTVSRKLEEILLVYILENNRIVSKERMLEVYFNIIEWGPNVYGIGEASRFYFQKSPSELTFNECLFLLESSQAQENSCINLMTRAS
jgi:membrane peptidoglycan carboxypeptidase